jgi:hypothetical protein
MGFIPLELSGPSAATRHSQWLMAFFFANPRLTSVKKKIINFF